MSESKLDRIDAKIDNIQEKINEINIILAGQHESLKLHIKRTDLLEKIIEPLKKHVTVVHGLLQAVGFIAILVGIIEGIVKIKYGH